MEDTFENIVGFIIFIVVGLLFFLGGCSIGSDLEKSKAISANAGEYRANPTNGITEFVYFTNKISLNK